MPESKAYEIPRIKQLLQTRARHFGYQGSETGWSREDALTVIGELADTEIGILGGDVWHMEGATPRHAYAGWYLNPNEGEAPRTFAVRSREKATEYIKKYPESGETFYVLVFSR